MQKHAYRHLPRQRHKEGTKSLLRYSLSESFRVYVKLDKDNGIHMHVARECRMLNIYQAKYTTTIARSTLHKYKRVIPKWLLGLSSCSLAGKRRGAGSLCYTTQLHKIIRMYIQSVTFRKGA